jgi:sarcosine oxidase, subunit gamma
MRPELRECRLSEVAGLRVGYKGADAIALLAAAGWTVPAAPNRYVLRADPAAPARLLRLGRSELLLDLAPGSPLAAALPDPAGDGRAWRVLREDRCFLLAGEGAIDCLAQSCSFDFGASATPADAVILTLVCDVAVTLVHERAADGRSAFRLWCDPSFADYLAGELEAIVADPEAGAAAPSTHVTHSTPGAHA